RFPRPNGRPSRLGACPCPRSGGKGKRRVPRPFLSRRNGTMKTSIATVSISGEFGEKLTAIAAAGFEGVEIFENDFLAFDASPAEVGRMVRDAGLEITLFQPF